MKEATGFNPTNINALGGANGVINQTAQNVATIVIENLQKGLVTPISNVWYAPEAVEYFNDVVNEKCIKPTGKAIFEIFDTFRSWIEEAGKNWEEQTRGQTGAYATNEAVNVTAISDVNMSLNLEEIKTIDTNGNVKIIESEALGVASNLETVRSQILDAVSAEAKLLDASTSFFGHEQDTAIENAFVKVAEVVNDIFGFLSEGDNSLKGAINKFVEGYSTHAQAEFNAFDKAEIKADTTQSAGAMDGTTMHTK